MKNFTTSAFLLLLISFTFASVVDSEQQSLNKNDPQIETLQEGDGKTFPQQGKKVWAHYKGTLTNGKKFDSSYDRGTPFSFTLGVGQVIKCWDFTLARMSVGQKVKVLCPSQTAYGSRGAGGLIPPNSDLYFEVELVKIE